MYGLFTVVAWGFPTICFWTFWVSKSILGLGPCYILPIRKWVVWKIDAFTPIWCCCLILVRFFFFVKFGWLFCNFVFPALATEHRMVNACQCYGMLWACARPLKPQVPDISSMFIEKPQPVPLYPHVFQLFVHTHTSSYNIIIHNIIYIYTPFYTSQCLVIRS